MPNPAVPVGDMVADLVAQILRTNPALADWTVDTVTTEESRPRHTPPRVDRARNGVLTPDPAAADCRRRCRIIRPAGCGSGNTPEYATTPGSAAATAAAPVTAAAYQGRFCGITFDIAGDLRARGRCHPTFPVPPCLRSRVGESGVADCPTLWRQRSTVASRSPPMDSAMDSLAAAPIGAAAAAAGCATALPAGTARVVVGRPRAGLTHGAAEQLLTGAVDAAVVRDVLGLALPAVCLVVVLTSCLLGMPPSRLNEHREHR
jgi:hypothetical protein